jgi:anti-sigma B factor antagonist
MTINKTSHGGKLVYELIGRLDATTAPELESELQKSMDSAERLEFDFSQLEYISSAGLRVLLFAQKTMNKHGSMVIRSVNTEIMEIFDITGFSDILTIE